jgi:DNA ligase-1
MQLVELVQTSAKIASTSARNGKVGTLADLLRRVPPDEIETGVAFLAGHPRQGRIGIGGAAVHAVSKRHATEPSLTLAEVDATLETIATRSGPGSTGERARLLETLFARATEPEADFLIRLILGELRQGALGGIMEDAVARASSIPISEIRHAAMLAGDLEPVARAALSEGRSGLAQFHLEVFRPIGPMLAQTGDDVADAVDRLGEAAFEYKLDGARVQVHRQGDDVRIYSRTLRDVTPAAPEIVEAVRALPVRELILDGELVALRPDGRPQPFQITMRRFGRKLDVERLRSELPLTPAFFDLLRAEGSDRFHLPARERFAALREIAPALSVPQRITADRAAAQAFFEEALRHGHEGILAKSMETPYEAGRRGAGWLKVKPAHTLDLVVLAAEWGHGRRSGMLSNIHLGAREPVTGAFVMLGKTFKGMTDAMLAWQTQRFQDLAVATNGYVVHLRPEQVVEIAFGDVQESSKYPGGVALRFARVKRYRDDKTAAEADTLEAVRRFLPHTTSPPASQGVSAS